MKKTNQTKHGFTLAEILITLTVIGVVAALTIPTLLQNTQQAELKTAWKKEFADLNQATISLITDAGGSLKGYFSNSVDMRNKFASKLTPIKTCTNSLTEGCWYDTWYSLDGTKTGPSSYYTFSGMILNNGSLVTVDYKSTDCSTNWGGQDNFCGVLSVDVNGLKPPTTVGKDIFFVLVAENQLIPRGVRGDAAGACTGSTGQWSGYGCAAEYLYN